MEVFEINISKTKDKEQIILLLSGKPTDCLTLPGFDATSNQFYQNVSAICFNFNKAERILTIIVLHAPLEPRRTKMQLFFTSKSTPSNTDTFLQDFFNPCTEIAIPFCIIILFLLIMLIK